MTRISPSSLSSVDCLWLADHNYFWVRAPRKAMARQTSPQKVVQNRTTSTVFVSWVFGEDTVKVLEASTSTEVRWRNLRSEAPPWTARCRGSNVSAVCMQRCTESSSAALLATALSVRVLQVTDIKLDVSVDVERKLSWCLSTPQMLKEICRLIERFILTNEAFTNASSLQV